VFFPIAINTDQNGAFSLGINLIPFYFHDCSMLGLCVRDIIENIILTIPFGFGINFLTRIKPGNIIWLAITIGLGFELYQLLMSLVFRSGFRAVDINDSILNGTGVLLGYVLFRVFAWVYLKVTKRFEIKHKWLFAYIYSISLHAQASVKK
jgi:glycopeptide antibiotics resistance protein